MSYKSQTFPQEEPSRTDPLAKRIIRLLQEEAMTKFPAFPEAFGQLSPLPFDGSRKPFGTDGNYLYYEPSLVCGEFLHSSGRLKHAYLHVHLHCLCLHMMSVPVNRRKLWNQACDLAAELMAWQLSGGCGAGDAGAPVREIAGLFLELLPPGEGKTAKPEDEPLRLAKYTDALALLPHLERSPELRLLADQCALDTHAFWYTDSGSIFAETARASAEGSSLRHGPGQKRGRDLLAKLSETAAKPWLLHRKKLNSFLSAGAGARNRPAGDEAAAVSLQRRDEIDYRKFLHQFAVPREEPVLDMESFDYIPYCYGLARYGNMPFWEPLEYSEVNRLDELAIAIDTSGSCSGWIVRRFLEETWNILRQRENFFSRMRLHLIQCDSMIQDHQIFTSAEQWEAALPGLRIQGLGNTDFRPVFDYLNALIQKKEIRRLRALLYFTDGDGIYPRTRPPFETAFVFLNHRLEKQKIPEWGIRLNLNLPEQRLC